MSASENRIRITLVRSPIGRPPAQRKTARALGLRKLNQSVVQKDSPEIKGMVRKIVHLVEVEPWDGE